MIGRGDVSIVLWRVHVWGLVNLDALGPHGLSRLNCFCLGALNICGLKAASIYVLRGLSVHSPGVVSNHFLGAVCIHAPTSLSFLIRIVIEAAISLPQILRIPHLTSDP